MIEEELPDSWEIAPLDELATFQNGRAFKKPEWKTTGLPIIRIQNLNDHNAAFNYTPAEHEPQFKIRDGDLLFAWAASLGVYLWKRGNAWLNQHIFRVAPEIGVEKLYLYYLLQNAIDHFYAKARGSGMVHITKGELVGTHLPLPPLNEQKRIVAKIEELFSELDAGEESLRKARRQLGVYRQSLLKQAFESKLTAPWRAQHPHLLESPDQLLARIQAERGSLHSQRLENWEKEVKIWKKRGEQGKRPTKPRKPEDPTRLSAEENAELVKLPRGWCWMTLESLSSPKSRSIQSGPFGSSLKHEEFTDEGILVIGIDNVQKGYFSSGSQNRISPEKYRELKKYTARPKDFLITVMATVGRCCRIPDEIETAIITKHVYRVSPNLGLIEPDYLVNAALGCPAIVLQIEKDKFGQTRPGLNGGFIKALPVPLCSLPEQQEIVRLLDEQFEVIEQNEREIDAALKRSEALRQSILKKAFTGQLVPQDSADEPASALLARIRAEREEAENKKAATKKKTARKKRTSRKRSTASHPDLFQ